MRVGLSKVAGVGVIAIRPIPKNVDPFKTATSGGCHDMPLKMLSKSDVDSLPDTVRKLVHDFISPTKDGLYGVPARGMSTIDVSFYLNHSDTPNLDVVSRGCTYMSFVTNREIAVGEELSISYKTGYGQKVEF